MEHISFENFLYGFQFSLLSQSLLIVAIRDPSMFILMLNLSVMIGVTNLFMNKVSYVDNYNVHKHTYEMEEEEEEEEEKKEETSI